MAMLRVLAMMCAAFAASAAGDDLPAAVHIPAHQVGTSVAVTGVCWNVAAGAAAGVFEHTFEGLSEAAVTFHLTGVEGRASAVELCVGGGGRCRANHKSGQAFWTATLGLGSATAVTLRVTGASSGCVDQMAQLSVGPRNNGKRSGASGGQRLDVRQHLTLGCSTDVDDTVAAKCSAAGACDPLPAVYDRAAATASIMFEKSGGWYVCTSWASSSAGHMFTNNHCVATQDVADTVEFFFGCEMGCGYNAATCDYNSTLTGSAKCRQCDLAEAFGTPCYSQMSGPTASGATLVRTSSTLDYTVLRVNTPEAVACFGDANCPMRLVPSNYAVGLPDVFMFQHSAGLPKLLSYYDSPTPGHLTTGRLQIRGVSGGCYVGDLAYDADASGGSSGSVVALAPDYCNPGSGEM
jgi:serine protease